MADKLLVVMVNTGPRNAAELGAPLLQATVAVARDYEVEIVLTGRAGELAKRGEAESIDAKKGSSKTVYDFIRDAHEAAARFKVCSPTLDLWGNDLIPEIDEIGGAHVIRQAMDDKVVTFTY